MYIERRIQNQITNIFKDTQVLYLNGIRQCGKSTLAMDFASREGFEYLSFDSPSLFSLAKHDPQGFISSIKSNVVLDEIQRVPEIFRCLKILVDDQRKLPIQQRIRILLTGSTNILLLPMLADSLVGRMQILSLYPFSISEFNHSNFIERIFKKDFPLKTHKKEFDIISTIHKASFPEISINSDIDTTRWFDSYLSTLLTRDIRDISNIARPYDMYTMLKIFAGRIGSLINESSLSRDCNLNLMTFRRYRNLLENMFVTQRVFPWFKNTGKRFTKSTKNYFTDTQMLFHVLGYTPVSLKEQAPTSFGHIVENFVFSELLKNKEDSIKLYHLRTQDNKEVDFILEKNNQDLVGIEVKSKSNITDKDFDGLKFLKQITGSSFKCGIVLYLGKITSSFSSDMYAVSMSEM